MNGRKSVSNFVDILLQLLSGNRKVRLNITGSGSSVKLPGGASIDFPNPTSIVATRDQEGIRLDFLKPRPKVKVRKFIFGVHGTMTRVSVTPETVYISLDGLPNITLRVE